MLQHYFPYSNFYTRLLFSELAYIRDCDERKMCPNQQILHIIHHLLIFNQCIITSLIYVLSIKYKQQRKNRSSIHKKHINRREHQDFRWKPNVAENHHCRLLCLIWKNKVIFLQSSTGGDFIQYAGSYLQKATTFSHFLAPTRSDIQPPSP